MTAAYPNDYADRVSELASADMYDSYISRRDGNIPSNNQEPVSLTWRQIIIVSPHWRCCILTAILFVCSCFLLWCSIPRILSVREELPCRNGLVWIPTSITLLFYLLYIIECMHCNIHSELTHFVPYEHAQQMIEQWVHDKPLIKWKAICYHYGRGVRVGSHNGTLTNGVVQHTQFMRINSHSAEGRYYPNECGYMDRSTFLTNMEHYTIIKLDIEKYFSFGCPCSEAAYKSQRKRFYESNMVTDDFIEVQETFHLSGSSVPDSLCILGSSARAPWFCWKSVFWILSLLCLSWPLRIYIERKTSYANFSVHKQFGARCDGRYRTSAPSMSSTDSGLNENLFGIIPSYSEALLMSCSCLTGGKISAGSGSRNKTNIKCESYSTVVHKPKSGRSFMPLSNSKTLGDLYKPSGVSVTFKKSATSYFPLIRGAVQMPYGTVGKAHGKTKPKGLKHSLTTQNLTKPIKVLWTKSKTLEEMKLLRS